MPIATEMPTVMRTAASSRVCQIGSTKLRLSTR